MTALMIAAHAGPAGAVVCLSGGAGGLEGSVVDDDALPAGGGAGDAVASEEDRGEPVVWGGRDVHDFDPMEEPAADDAAELPAGCFDPGRFKGPLDLPTGTEGSGAFVDDHTLILDVPQATCVTGSDGEFEAPEEHTLPGPMASLR